MKKNILLIPGLNNTAETWNQVKQYLPTDWNVQTVNVPALPNVDLIADELLKDQKEPFYLCGFSFGGYVALSMLERAPELIQGFILLGSATTADSEAQKTARKNAIKRAQNGEYFDMMEANGPLTFHPDHLLDKDIMYMRNKIVKEYGPETFIAHVQATMGRPDRTTLFNESAIPKLVIGGKEDQVVPADKLMEQAKNASCTDFEIISHTGHMMPLEQPVEVAKVLQNWIEKH